MNTKHLKAKILDLAIRGKLVLQDSSEGNAADLLQKIREEKLSCHPELDSESKKKIKADKNSSFIIKADDGRHYEQFADGTLKDIEDEIPCKIPVDWQWTRLKSISTEILYGVSESAKKEGKYKLLRITDIQNDKVNWSTVPYTDYDEKTVDQYLLKKGDLVFARTGATVGKSFLINENIEDVIYASYLIRVRPTPQIDSKYIKYYFQSIIYWEQVTDKSLGNGQPNVNGTSLSKLYIPLPPLAEQQRIVSAIEKAFEQIDIIEKNKLNLKTYIKQTKAKVLDLAIHGKLVEQNPQEGNAFELLEKIRNEKEELFKQKKLKEDKKSSFIIKADDGKHYEQFADGTLKDIEDEIPFEIPESWCWCRLRNITTILGDGLHGTPKYNKNGNYYFINGNNLENGKIIIKPDTQKIDDDEYQKYKKDLNENTVLVSINGTVGNIAFYNNEKIILGKSACYFNLVSSSFKNYIYLLVKTSFFLVYATTNATGSTIKNVSLDTMRNFLFPLPPLAEQQRIVEKIEQIFAQLDILEKSLGE